MNYWDGDDWRFLSFTNLMKLLGMKKHLQFWHKEKTLPQHALYLESFRMICGHVLYPQQEKELKQLLVWYVINERTKINAKKDYWTLAL